MKPLIRTFRKDNPECEGAEYPCLGGRLTTNGWFLLECKEFVVMMPGASKQAKFLFEEIFPGLSGLEKKQLLLVPDKADKYGAYIAVDDEVKTTYHWNPEEYILTIGAKKPPGEDKKQLSLADFD
jgi:hypothetical protein